MKQHIRQTLIDCREKLTLYRQQHSGEYIGGVEYTQLLNSIDIALGSTEHCSTCQCNRVHGEMPSHPVEPNVKRTKSWHHG